jgi:phage anti-repressor protein
MNNGHKMKNITNFTQENALALLNSTDDFPVDFELAYKWLGFSRKNNAKQSLLGSGFEEGSDFLLILNNQHKIEVETKTSARGRKKGEQVEEIWLTNECFKSWGMMASTEKGKEVRKYFLECERKLKSVIAERVAPSKPRSLLDLSQSQLFRLSSYLDGVDQGNDVSLEIVKGIAPVFLDASPEAALLAYNKVRAEDKENELLAHDLQRQLYCQQFYGEGEKERAADAADVAAVRDAVAEMEAIDGYTSAFNAFEAALSSHQLLGGDAPILEPAQLII